MEIRWMKAFLAVAEELHYGRAAERLHIAQPAVSQQVVKLEQSLKVRLFERDSHGVRLTDAGRAFLEPCRQALGSIVNAGLQARNAGTGEYGKVRFGFNAAFNTDDLLLVTGAVSARYPNLDLELDTTRSNAEQLARLKGGALDVALVSGPVKGLDLSWRSFRPSFLGVILRADHPLAAQEQVPITALKDEQFLLVGGNEGWTLRGLVVDACEEAGFRPKEIGTSGDGLTTMALAVAGVGVCFAGSRSTNMVPPAAVFRPLAERIEIPRALVWHESSRTAAIDNVLRVAEGVLD